MMSSHDVEKGDAISVHCQVILDKRNEEFPCDKGKAMQSSTRYLEGVMRARGKNGIPIKERKITDWMPSFGVRAKLNYPCQPRDKKPQEWIKKRGREGSHPVIVGFVLHL